MFHPQLEERFNNPMSAFRSSPRTLRVLQAGAILAAIGTGYAVRDIKPVDAQGAASTVPPVQKAPVVESAATQDARATQTAFRQVSDAVEKAVVTIETQGARSAPTSGQRSPFPGVPGGPGGGSPQDFQEFFKRFQKEFGFGEQSYQPNSWTGRVMREKAEVAWQKVQSRRGGGLGSGMIYRSDGLILTNAHVVRGANTVKVTLSDGREFKKAEVLGRDERTDIAVVKIPATNLPVVKLGDSKEVNVGDWAIAVGNPFGLDHTLTVGVISAKGREIDLARNGDTRTDYLQTDASINPGNSGGPLLNINGLVIGVNNAIYSESGGNQGIGFAIPVNTARFVADQLAKNGKVRRGYLGVSISSAEDKGAAFGLDPNLKGVLVEKVENPNTPGGKAGLKAGDVITKFNGETVTKPNELQRLVGSSEVGSQATMTVVRGDQTLTLRATLEELPDTIGGNTPDEAPGAPDSQNNPAAGGTSLAIPGLKARNLSPAVARALGIKTTQGVGITDVNEDSPAGEAGLQRGDVVLKVGQKTVNNVDELQSEIQRILKPQTGDEKKVALQIERNGQRSFVIVTLGE